MDASGVLIIFKALQQEVGGQAQCRYIALKTALKGNDRRGHQPTVAWLCRAGHQCSGFVSTPIHSGRMGAMVKGHRTLC